MKVEMILAVSQIGKKIIVYFLLAPFFTKKPYLSHHTPPSDSL